MSKINQKARSKTARAAGIRGCPHSAVTSLLGRRGPSGCRAAEAQEKEVPADSDAPWIHRFGQSGAPFFGSFLVVNVVIDNVDPGIPWIYYDM